MEETEAPPPPKYQCDKRLGGVSCQSGRDGYYKKPLFLSGIEIRPFNSKPVNLLTELFRFTKWKVYKREKLNTESKFLQLLVLKSSFKTLI
jgi:hypothetical protein